MYEILRKSSVRSILKDIIAGYIIDYKISLPKKQITYFINNKPLDEKIIQQLLENNIIESEGNESIIACPVDGSFNLRVILVCPIHKTPLQKIEIFEDRTSGNIIQGSMAAVSQNTVRRGYFLKCEKGETVINPAFVYRCENGHTFTLDEAIVANIRKYKVNKEIISQIKEYFNELHSASEYLSSKGYSVDEERSVKGLSGVKYDFDLKVNKENKQTVFYFIKGDKIDEFLSLLPKLYDISQLGDTNLNIFVVTGKRVNEDLLHMFDRYNVKVIKAENTEELLDFLVKNLK